MKVLEQGQGPQFMEADPDRAREFFANKSRALTDKRMSVKEAVDEFITDGCYLGSGGFGSNRISTAVLHEIIRAGRKNMGFCGLTATHDFELMCAAESINRVDASYIVGLEARGLSPKARQLMCSGKVQVTEWSNYALSSRLKAAAEGVSFAVIRCMMGTDTMARSAAKVVECPFTGKKMALVPALWPDVSVIHVHEADIYGNSYIRGISVCDLELARASKRLIITAERIVSGDEFRRDPNRTAIPYYLVDAVVEAPYGSYPGNMAGEYFSDEAHLAEWLQVEKDPEQFEKFLDKFIYSVASHEEYLYKCGGMKRLQELRGLELMLAKPNGR